MRFLECYWCSTGTRGHGICSLVPRGMWVQWIHVLLAGGHVASHECVFTNGEGQYYADGKHSPGDSIARRGHPLRGSAQVPPSDTGCWNRTIFFIVLGPKWCQSLLMIDAHWCQGDIPDAMESSIAFRLVLTVVNDCVLQFIIHHKVTTLYISDASGAVSSFRKIPILANYFCSTHLPLWRYRWTTPGCVQRPLTFPRNRRRPWSADIAKPRTPPRLWAGRKPPPRRVLPSSNLPYFIPKKKTCHVFTAKKKSHSKMWRSSVVPGLAGRPHTSRLGHSAPFFLLSFHISSKKRHSLCFLLKITLFRAEHMCNLHPQENNWKLFPQRCRLLHVTRNVLNPLNQTGGSVDTRRKNGRSELRSSWSFTAQWRWKKASSSGFTESKGELSNNWWIAFVSTSPSLLNRCGFRAKKRIWPSFSRSFNTKLKQ